MRDSLSIPVVMLALAAVPAWGQASGNQRALDSLGPAHAASHHVVHRHRTAHRPQPDANQASTNQGGAKPGAAPPSPTIPPAPPPPPVIAAPVINVPLHPDPPLPPVPVVAGAAGEASAIAGGTRISFGPDSADLNAATMRAVQDFAARLKADPAARAEIDAFARGPADDPSTPRRTALSRGLAARAVLINGGIASTRIYVRAIGAPHDDSPPDRVDLTRTDSMQQAAAAP